MILQMFEDKKFNKIDVELLETESQPLGEGGFGAVYKTRYRMVLYCTCVLVLQKSMLHCIFMTC